MRSTVPFTREDAKTWDILDRNDAVEIECDPIPEWDLETQAKADEEFARHIQAKEDREMARRAPFIELEELERDPERYEVIEQMDDRGRVKKVRNERADFAERRLELEEECRRINEKEARRKAAREAKRKGIILPPEGCDPTAQSSRDPPLDNDSPLIAAILLLDWDSD